MISEIKDIRVNDKLTSGYHKSYWIDSVKPLVYSPLREDIVSDVVVVGAGISGLSVAYQLSKLGKKVVVVEDGFIGSGETGRTSAHLTAAFDDRYYEVERIYGTEGAKLVAASHTKAINFIEEVITSENISCDFKRIPGYLFLHPSDKKESLNKEFTAATNAGLKVEMVGSIPGISGDEQGIKFNDQAQFNPLKYIHGLCNAIIARGGKIFTETRAREMDHTGIITSENFSVKADHIVIATNTPVNNKYVLHLKQFPFRTYMIGALVVKDSLPQALWWDTGDHEKRSSVPPYHYVRVERFNDRHDILLAGGEDHPTGLAMTENVPEEERYNAIESWVRKKFPIKEVVYHWSGQVMEPVDALGYIGHNPFDAKNIYVVSGDSGNGLTHGTIAGMLIPDLILNVKNDWKKIYDPSRFKFLKTGSAWFKELVGGLASYVKEYPRDTDSQKILEIRSGEGKVLEIGGEKYGVYRDIEDQLHFVTAECSHLKCIINWNKDERSWDCPCHGSRFTFDGKVLNGPANNDLLHHVIIDA
jgi:glycine/D-amino acid oxidase-like deaminating enzyme/nitrite reductase/ring-hydroxylating ferredoxin subunit